MGIRYAPRRDGEKEVEALRTAPRRDSPSVIQTAEANRQKVKELATAQQIEAQVRENLLKSKYETARDVNQPDDVRLSAVRDIQELEGVGDNRQNDRVAAATAGAAKLAQAGGAGTVASSTLGAAGAGAGIGAATGAQYGGAYGAAIGAVVGTTAGILQAKAARKKAKAEAQATALENVAEIEKETEGKRQSAYSGMITSLRNAFLGPFKES